jgi:acetate kinase
MILIINSGSSSIKFALYAQHSVLGKTLYGQISQIGLPTLTFNFHDLTTSEKQTLQIKTDDYSSAISYLIKWLETKIDFLQIKAIGHRVVHGMQHTTPSLITDELLKDLKEIIPYDPDHLPNEIKLIVGFKKKYPEVPQYACFDTAFHKDMPRVAKVLPIPRRFDSMGIHRYGFHGLSYTYLMQELERSEGKDAANGRVILAHLGSGASLAAVHQGKSTDTSMGFTPNAGVPMSTRSGDIDPGVAWFMMKNENLSPDQFNHLISHESGLLGISETSADMSELLKQEETDVRSAEAVDLFCYEIKKCIGAYAAALCGIDTLVFAAGIGENAPVIRTRICDGLGFLGIELDEKRNSENAHLISSDASRVKVHVIHTDEELIIAQIVSELIAHQYPPK